MKLISKSETLVKLKEFIEKIGPGFHPDTSAQDYVKEDGTKSFTRQECEDINYGLDQISESLEHDLYLDEAFRIYHDLFHKEPEVLHVSLIAKNGAITCPTCGHYNAILQEDYLGGNSWKSRCRDCGQQTIGEVTGK